MARAKRLQTTMIAGKLLAEASKIDPADSLGYRRTREQEFKENNYHIRKEAIDLLELFLIMNREIGGDFAKNYIENHDNTDEDHQFQALLRLHIRACQTTHEILTLIKHGFADGAYARWRNLYETAAIALFIQQKNGAGERFLDYRHIEDYHRARTHQKYTKQPKYAELLHINPKTNEEMEILESK
jgi:hypothetical protein